MAKKAKKDFKKIDILNHELVPKHMIMTADEVKDLLDTLKIRLVQLPRIYEDDPVVQMLGAKINDVIKIERKSETTVDKSNYYRFVVKR
ncbi:MAG: DNA-directed RNA polymerase subunit H [Promethearchaeota archaeon]